MLEGENHTPIEIYDIITSTDWWVLLLLILIVIAIVNQRTQSKNQKRSHEKVIELIEKGHDAKLCPKCKGKGHVQWDWVSANCPECDGLGYIYKLKESRK
jgi:hypothetical protein